METPKSNIACKLTTLWQLNKYSKEGYGRVDITFEVLDYAAFLMDLTYHRCSGNNLLR